MDRLVARQIPALANYWKKPGDRAENDVTLFYFFFSLFLQNSQGHEECTYSTLFSKPRLNQCYPKKMIYPTPGRPITALFLKILRSWLIFFSLQGSQQLYYFAEYWDADIRYFSMETNNKLFSQNTKKLTDFFSLQGSQQLYYCVQNWYSDLGYFAMETNNNLFSQNTEMLTKELIFP